MDQTASADHTPATDTSPTHAVPATTAPLFVPYYDRLLLRRVDDAGAAAQHSTFNFALTGAMQEKPQLFEVVAVGGGHLTDAGVVCPLTSLPGDHVLVG